MINILKMLVKKLIKIFQEKQIHPVVVYKTDKDILAGKVALITGGSSGIGLAILCGERYLLYYRWRRYNFVAQVTSPLSKDDKGDVTD